jgi:cyclic beta-1,2-glucan synthetase
VPLADGRREKNPLSPLARWKLFDNLRRSLVAPTLTALLVLCWALLPEPSLLERRDPVGVLPADDHGHR